MSETGRSHGSRGSTSQPRANRRCDARASRRRGSGMLRQESVVPLHWVPVERISWLPTVAAVSTEHTLANPVLHAEHRSTII